MPDLSFGRYDPLFRLAAGGMAEVYAARIRGEAGFQKLVAVKRMLPHLADDAEFVAMFLDEGRLAANIASPHVVSTLDLGRAEDGSLYIVMELVIGSALSTLLKASARLDRPVPVPIACEIVAQAASGLDDAHEAKTPTGVHLGIIHRDVSPQNVLVGVDGRTRMVDFGVARAVLRQSHTSTGTLKGKFAYFSPEQAAARDVDRRSDVFALGIVAWETLLSRRLFEADNPLEQITRVRSMPVPRPTELRPDVPEAVTEVVMKALERDPALRWESAGAFAAALRRASPGPTTAREIGAFVDAMVGPAIQQMQARIEASLAGEDLVTQAAVRTPARGIEEPTTQATPSAPAGHVVDLPTLLRPLPAEAVEPASARASTAAATTAPPSGAARIWLAAIAGVAVLAIVVVAALATRDPEPIATPLPSPAGATPILPVAASPATSPTPTEPPPTTAVASIPAPPPTTPHPATRETPRPTTVRAPAADPTTPIIVARTPRDPAPTAASTDHASTDHASTDHASTAPRPTTTRTPPAGLAGDDAFDQGI